MYKGNDFEQITATIEEICVTLMMYERYVRDNDMWVDIFGLLLLACYVRSSNHRINMILLSLFHRTIFTTDTTRMYVVVVMKAISGFVKTSGSKYLRAIVESKDFVRTKNAFVADLREGNQKSIAAERFDDVLDLVCVKRKIMENGDDSQML